jgi:hypothetical protein
MINMLYDAECLERNYTNPNVLKAKYELTNLEDLLLYENIVYICLSVRLSSLQTI